ncbi:MAG: electron transfer flavoprotein subunit alpha [Deltaproteobacteria bacterium]|nr:MAG: electron transfer flavoprotein subunit alpha [Deltaproteobacteria bacterium]
MRADKSGQGGIWVLAEQRQGVLREVSLELLGKAREMADLVRAEVTAVLLGREVSGLVPALISAGADQVLLAGHPGLEPYRLLPYTHVLTELIKEHQPEIFLIGATALGVELAPRVAARLRTGLSAHCIDLAINEDGRLLQMVPGWGGGVIATIICPDHRPQMATVMPGVMRPVQDPRRQGRVVPVEVSLPQDLGPKVLEVTRKEPEGLPLEKAEVLVAGGWGVGGPEKWTLVEELASVLDEAVGATRPPVDEGWAGEGQMIGQSGKTVRPKLYIGLGISGMMHHVVGMDQSGFVVAINQDPKAAIFEVCDLGLVADLDEILPRLIAETRKVKG